MRPVENTSSPTPVRRTAEPEPPAKPEPAPSPPPETSSPAPSGSTAESSPVKTSAVLERPEPAPSDPASSRSVTRRQAGVARELTGAGGFRALLPEETSGTVAASDTNDDEGQRLDHLVDDPLEKEQRSDLKPPEAFRPGSEVPELPNFQEQTPASTEKRSDGSLAKTYDVDGTTYTVVKRKGENVRTYFEKDGVNYSDIRHDDGSSDFTMSVSRDDGYHQRRIETDPEGQATETSYSRDGFVDASGNHTSQSREVVVAPDGTRTLSEEVQRPDGGTSSLTRTTRPSGAASETYSYRGGETTINRTTETNSQGASETRTEKSYVSDQNLEALVATPAPPQEGIDPPPALPGDDREPTRVSEVTVVTGDGRGNDQLQYSERSFSQTSGDVQLETGDIAEGLETVDDETNVTRTVTQLQVLGEDGQLIPSTGASQTYQAVAQRGSDGGRVTVSNTSTWNSSGESSSSYSVDGLTEDEYESIYRRSRVARPRPALKVGDETVQLMSNNVQLSVPFSNRGRRIEPEGASTDDYAIPDRMKDDMSEWLGEGGYLDFSRSVSFDAEGEIENSSKTWGSVEENGDGRTVTVSKAGEGPSSWISSDVSNGGQDYKRQTVIEGTEVSIYEERETLGEGQFRYLSETTEGGTTIARNSAERREVSADEVQTAVDSGELAQEHADGLLAGGAPYYLERTEDYAERLLDKDGNLRLGAEEEPLETGRSSESYRYSSENGYEFSQYYGDQTDREGRVSSNGFSATVDPDGDPPVRGLIDVSDENGVEQTELTVDSQGRLMSGGEMLGRYDLGDGDLQGFLAAGGQGNGLVNGIVKTLRGGITELERHAKPISYRGVDYDASPRLQPHSKNFTRLLRGADALGLVYGIDQIFSGETAKDQITGVGTVGSSTKTLLTALSGLKDKGGLAGRAGTFAAARGVATYGKLAGAAGGLLSIGTGLWDVFNAESGYDKAAGGLTATAGAVGTVSAFLGPPGWIIGGITAGVLSLAAFIVGKQDDIGEDHTEPLDSRLG